MESLFTLVELCEFDHIYKHEWNGRTTTQRIGPGVANRATVECRDLSTDDQLPPRPKRDDPSVHVRFYPPDRTSWRSRERHDRAPLARAGAELRAHSSGDDRELCQFGDESSGQLQSLNLKFFHGGLGILQ
jgi:hypothetical protein